MLYSNESKSKALKLISKLDGYKWFSLIFSMLYAVICLYMLINAFLTDTDYLSCSFIAIIVAFVLSIMFVYLTLSYINYDKETIKILKSICKKGGEIRILSDEECPFCNSKIVKKIETYTTGSEHKTMAKVVNFGGKLLTKGVLGELGGAVGGFFGGIVGMGEVGYDFGKKIGKGFAGEVYDESTEDSVNRALNTQKIQTYTVTFCPKGCPIPSNNSEFLSYIQKYYYYSRNDIIKIAFYFVIIPYCVLLGIVLLAILIGIPSACFYFLIGDMRAWHFEWDVYVGGSWSWFTNYLSNTWYTTFPLFCLLFVVDKIMTSRCEIKREAKRMEFGLYENKKLQVSSLVSLVIASATILILPFLHLTKIDQFFASENELDLGENGYEYVDLGLSVFWSPKNLGSITEDDPGYYLTWAQKSSEDTFNDVTYKRPRVDNETMRLYKQYDSASEMCGGNWRMPTKEEFKELFDECTWQRSEGRIIGTSKLNGNKIIFPVTGIRTTINRFFSGEEHTTEYTSFACYWTINAEGVFLDPLYEKFDEIGNQCVKTDGYHRMPVRPVLDKLPVEQRK